MTDVPAMPNSRDTANKIAFYIQWIGFTANEDEVQREIFRGMQNFRADTLWEAWNIESDLKREMG